MLVIRQEQMSALERARFEAFVARAARWAEEHHAGPAQALGPDGVRAAVRAAVERARTIDVLDENGILLYLRAMLERGPDFDREPWAAFLGDPAMPPALKLVELATALHRGAT